MKGFRRPVKFSQWIGQWPANQLTAAAQLQGALLTRRSLFWLTKGPTFRGIRPAAAPARRGRLEAVLFLTREPLSLRRLAQLANLTDGTEARTLLNDLQARYDERQCAFQIARVAGGYQLLSRMEFARWLRPKSANERETRLSVPALETLVLVAYRQPILRAEVEAIRGVACGELLRQLLDRDLLRIVGRSEELGRPLRYGTTKRFLEKFGLSSLDELPWAEQLRRRTLSEPESADSRAKGPVTNADLTGSVDDT
ncbi:MAG TPA: SMC-Scp complex subunit ScpB [Lacipirellulaceae bacterium]|nr:SMC-Scp complex subunit ScpB [Lacipirellulaceae bacterium]